MSMNGKNLESNLKNMVLVLLVITGSAGLSLAAVYNITHANILKVQEEKTAMAIKDVITGEYDNAPKNDEAKIQMDKNKGEEISIYPAMKGNQLVGAAIKTFSNNGYSGKVWLMVGLKSDGTIQKINVLEQKETPGLGTKIEAPEFKNQFTGKNPTTFKLKVKKDGGDVDAITAATISSRAFSDAVQRAYEALNNYKKQKGMM